MRRAPERPASNRLAACPGLRTAAIFLIAAATGPGLGAREALTLRVNDAIGPPGGRIAVVVRTYAPRTLGQGQLCMNAGPRLSGKADPAGDGVAPLAALEDFVVFSELGDVVSTATFDESTQTAVITFASPSGTVNQTDGPLAVFFFRLARAVPPGELIGLRIDAANTSLFDPQGRPVAIAPRDGELQVRLATDPLVLSADGDVVVPGQVARLGVATAEPFAIAAGSAGFRYDPEVAGGPPVVSMDPRHGDATFSVDDSLPGLVLVSFTSGDATLNSVPGDLIAIDLPTSAAVSPGVVSPIFLDPAWTFLDGPDGGALELSLEGGEIAFVPPTPLFADGFESGDLSAWPASAP